MTENTQTRSPLTRQLNISDIEENSDLKIEVSRAEMADIVGLLDLEALDALTLHYLFRPAGLDLIEIDVDKDVAMTIDLGAARRQRGGSAEEHGNHRK